MTEINTYGSIQEPAETQGPVQPASHAHVPAPQDTGISILDEMAADLEEDILNVTKIWALPDRPNFKVELNTYISGDDFKRYQKSASGPSNRKSRRAKRGETPDQADRFALYTAVIREKSTQILYKGQPLKNADGSLRTLNDDEFLKMIQATKAGADVASTSEAIEFFLTPGFLLQLGESVVAEAGYDGEANPENP